MTVGNIISEQSYSLFNDDIAAVWFWELPTFRSRRYRKHR